MRHLLKFRLWVLGVVNGLILLHVVLYYAFDRRAVGCIDFFGLATFLGNGQVTAGTVFLGITVLITLLLGRVFCGWGCHFALFQDLLSRFFARIGVQTPFRRSRLELLVPPILFVVTLLYPIAAWWRGNGVPGGLTVDLAYPDVWHLLPRFKGTFLILLVDVVTLTLLFGSRAFCRYVCPYGLFLKFFHALSPVRVVKSGDCSNCSGCARACPTGVPIKYEIENFTVIRDLSCMNCGDCVASCPEGALALKPTRRAYTRAFLKGAFVAGQPKWAEAVLFITGVVGIAVYRGREYGDFLAAGLGLTVGATIVAAIEPARFLRARWIKRFTAPRLRLAVVAIALYLSLGMLGQALGALALSRGAKSFRARDYEATLQAFSSGRRLAGALRPFTFYLDDFPRRAALRADDLAAEADRLMTAGSWRDAEVLYRSVISVQPDRIAANGNLGTALFKQGRFWEAAACYLVVLSYDPNDLVALYHLAMTRIQLGEMDDAVLLVQKILAVDTVGNAYDLIRQNPLFQLLGKHPGYRRVMAVYEPQRGASRLEPRR